MYFIFWLQYHIWKKVSVGKLSCFSRFLHSTMTLFPQIMALLINNIILQSCYSKVLSWVAIFHSKCEAFSPDVFLCTVYLTSTIRRIIDFSWWWYSSSIFTVDSRNVYRLFKKAAFYILKRAVLQHKYIPADVQFSDDLYYSIKESQKLNTLLDILINSIYWNRVVLRLLEILKISIGIYEVKVLLNKYKEAIFP